MSINFNAFEIGRRALTANQLGIDITGQNIANVNTPGYSRRSLHLAEVASASGSRFSIGAGVSIQGIQAYRDSFIESRIQQEIGIAGYLSARRDALIPVETALHGSAGADIQSAFADFFGAFRDLEANPDSVPLRATVAGRGQNLADTFHSTYSRLEEIRSGTDAQFRASVEEVNSLSERIATLNIEIRKVENSGGQADALRDQRNEFVNQIAELTGARTTVNSDFTINVTIGEGRSLVTGDTFNALTISNTPPSGLAVAEFKGEPAIFNEGVLKGFNSAVSDISDNLAALDGLAEQVAARVNSLHTSGTDLDGNAGIDFFDQSSPVTASNITINPLIAANARLVVASPIAQPAEHGTVAGQIAGLLTDTGTVVGSRTGSFSSIYGSLISDAGEQVRVAQDGLQTQAAIIAQATAQREAISGVSLDEEAINLLQYQKAFEAAARFIRVADEVTQTILSLAG
ncbi:MAG: flagellar hook-associated protein FlgK [Pyrinomonadaceae bacterium]|nr:flagellar hook-associated protein FlgK [Pyrinomonadaceae bacterium]